MPSAPTAPRKRRRPVRRRHSETTRTIARWMFHGHLWIGVLVSIAALLLSITGIMLNHKRVLGLMPEVENESPAALVASLPLAELVEAAQAALGSPIPVDRMDVRPDDGLVKVRFDDRVVTEVTVDLATGEVLHVGERNDVFLEKLHSGEIFGDNWILLSDLAAVGMCVLIISGYWIWLYPRSRSR